MSLSVMVKNQESVKAQTTLVQLLVTHNYEVLLLEILVYFASNYSGKNIYSPKNQGPRYNFCTLKQ